MGLFKRIPLHTEKAHLEFRAESFNLFNHSQLYVTPATFSTPNVVTASCYGGANNSAGDASCLANSSFLHASGSHLGRIFQFGLKLMF